MKAALTVAGLDPSGGAGLAMDLAAFRALGLHGLVAATCVTFQDPRSFEGALVLDPRTVERQIGHALATGGVLAAKTGMLGDASLAVAVARKLEGAEFPLVVDPVLRATLETDTTRKASAAARGELADAIREELVPLATLVTPNAEEATLLASVQVVDVRSAEEACRRLHGMGARAVLLKGGHLPPVGGTSVDLLYDGQRFTPLASPHVRGLRVHGSGCAYSALIAGHLALGRELHDAVRRSHAILQDARSRAHDVGGDLRLLPDLRPEADVALEPEAAELQRAVAALVTLLPPALVPEVGINVALAPAGARGEADVWALEGRIVRSGGKLVATGMPRKGGSGHVARVLIAARRERAEIAAAMNLRYHAAVVEAAKAAGLSVASFDRAKQPTGAASSLGWGVGEAVRGSRTAPDVVFDTGGPGKEAMVRLLGRDAADLVEKVRRLLQRLDASHIRPD